VVLYTLDSFLVRREPKGVKSEMRKRKWCKFALGVKRVVGRRPKNKGYLYLSHIISLQLIKMNYFPKVLLAF
jgi:hypothetical protein